MKFVGSLFLLLAGFLVVGNLALDAESYIAFIEERSRDENFVEEYTKWSTKLLSQPGYFFGSSHRKFPCSTNEVDEDYMTPTSVHALRPSDIKCVAAMGDSFTTGLGARGATPMELLFEDRGISWSAGGDYSYSQIATIPNILRKYNPTLKGASTKGHVMSHQKPHTATNQSNVAKSDIRSNSLSAQVDRFIYLLQNKSLCDWKNDWKMITIFIGADDLCHFCDRSNGINHTPEHYMMHVRGALDKLHNALIPRTLINLVLPPDVRGFKEFTNGSYICQTMLQKLCPCAVSPVGKQAKILDDYVQQYQEVLQNLTYSGQYDDRDDFTVVIQPFMAKTSLPIRKNGTIDFTYLSPDCFHFSGKGHSQAGISLWNNMFEPVGIKQQTWFLNQSLKCPSEEYPYIFTSKNSVKASEPQNMSQPISNTSIVPETTSSTSRVNMTGNYTYTSTITTIQPNSTSMSVNRSLIDVINSTLGRREPPEDKKSRDSDSSLSNTKLVVIVGFSIILGMILLVGIIRRRKQITLITRPRNAIIEHVDRFERLEEESDDDVYIRPNPSQSGYSDDKITKTHGTRMPLD